MIRHMLVAALAAALASMPALSQTDTTFNGMVLVNPKGAKTPWSAAMSGDIQLKSDTLKTSKSIAEVLRSNGIADDSKSRAMFQQLNPNLGTGIKQLQAGTKFNIIAPDDQTLSEFRQAKTVLKFDGMDPTETLSRVAVAEAIRNRRVAGEYTASAYASSSDQREHLAALAAIEKAGFEFNSKSGSLTGLEYSLAADRLDYANRKAAQINQTVLASGSIPTSGLEAIKQASKFLAPVTNSDKLTRKVRIVVTDLKGEAVKGLTVYSLPGQFFDDPNAYPEAYIRARLIRYSFPDETSPSSADVDGIDARVWVGPKRRYDDMVALIMKHQLAGKFSVLNESTLGKKDVEIRLTSPAEIVVLP